MLSQYQDPIRVHFVGEQAIQKLLSGKKQDSAHCFYYYDDDD